MSVEIRHPEAAEYDAWTSAVRLGFLQAAVEADLVARRADIDPSRTFGCFDDGRVVGTLRSTPTDLVVPGGRRLPTAELTNVTVSPTHRRQGLLTEMITRDLRACAERGEVLSALVAAEYPIYGRFGYGPAADGATLVIDASAELLPPRDAGCVRLTAPADVRDLHPAIYDAARVRWPGAVGRNDRWWDIQLGLIPYPGKESKLPRFMATSHDPDGRPDGFVTYTTEEIWERSRPVGTVHVEDLVGVTDAATLRLWRYCLEIDWVSLVKAEERSTDEMIFGALVNARLAYEERRGDLEWVRVLDPVAALEGRTYLCDGAVTVEIVDPLGLAGGRFRLEGGPDGATCSPTTTSAELIVPVDLLGAAYLGGRNLQSLARRGTIDEVVPGALARADAMFRGSSAPWCPTLF